MTKKILQEQKNRFQQINEQFPLALKILSLLIAFDLFFVLLHAYSFALPITESTKLLRLDMTFGYAEIFQYIKFIIIAIILSILFFKEKIGVYLIWSLFFLFLFVDDAFSIHEIYGGRIVGFFNIPGVMGLRAEDLGELIIAGFVGFVFLCFFLHTLFFGAKKAKKTTIHLLLLMGILVFFGVVADMAHSILVNLPGSGSIMVIEESGEMFAASLIAWYGSYLYLEQKNAIEAPSLTVKKKTPQI